MNRVLFEDSKLSEGYALGMKSVETSLSFIFEDFVQVGLQFFYIEKFAFMPNDLLVYFNAAIMILKALALTYRIWKYGSWSMKYDQESFW